MKKKLSIIIPCYNCEKTLKEAVDSCYKQGFNDNEFEIVMVDDASTDKTPSVMRDLVAEHKNIKMFSHNDNQGGGATRNTAVEHTQAEVIFCLDSDDILPHKSLKKMFDYLIKEDVDGVAVENTINFRGDDLSNISHIVSMAYVGEVIPFEALFQKNNLMCGIYQVFMFTKKAFEEAGGYPVEHGFDTQSFAWRFMVAGLVAKTCPGAYYLQRVENGESYYLREYNAGRTNANWQHIFLEYIDVFDDKVASFIKNYKTEDFTKSIFKEVCDFDKILADDYKERMDKLETVSTDSSLINKKRFIRRNSLRGIYLRVANKLRRRSS